MKRKGPVTRLKEEIEEKNKQAEELNDKYLRAYADLDNYRKQMQKKMEDYRRSYEIEFFNKIIPILDSFDRALSGAEFNANFDNFYKGVEIIHRQRYGDEQKDGG